MMLASFVSPSTDRWYESNFVSFLQRDGFSFRHVFQVFCECGGFHHFFGMGIFSDHFFRHLLDVAILREFQFHHFRPRRFTARGKEPHVHLHRFRRRCGKSWARCNCTTRALLSKLATTSHSTRRKHTSGLDGNLTWDNLFHNFRGNGLKNIGALSDIQETPHWNPGHT